jgi:hypothetical protein
MPHKPDGLEHLLLPIVADQISALEKATSGARNPEKEKPE